MSEDVINRYVEIRPFSEDEDDPGFRRMKCRSQRDAELVNSGANVNLNHERYYTRIVETVQDLPLHEGMP